MALSLCTSILPQARDAISLSSGAALVVLSHAIEDVVEQIPAASLVAGFQRFSNFFPQERRYRRLAADGRRIWVCGVPDVVPPPIDGVSFVPLRPDWPLAREWFVVVNTTGFFTALLASELTEGMRGAPRRFEALLTSDPATVDRVAQ